MHDVAVGKTASRRRPAAVSVVRGGRGVAGRIGLLGAIFTYAMRGVFASTIRLLGVVKFAEGRRQRRLIDDEYRQLAKALSKADREDIWKPAVTAAWLMIVTGWRRGEVAGLRWSEIDLPRRTAAAGRHRPADRRPVVDHQPVGGGQSQPRIGDIVFASRSGETPIVGYRKMWLRIAKLGDLPASITLHAAPWLLQSCRRSWL